MRKFTDQLIPRAECKKLTASLETKLAPVTRRHGLLLNHGNNNISQIGRVDRLQAAMYGGLMYTPSTAHGTPRSPVHSVPCDRLHQIEPAHIAIMHDSGQLGEASKSASRTVYSPSHKFDGCNSRNITSAGLTLSLVEAESQFQHFPQTQ